MNENTSYPKSDKFMNDEYKVIQKPQNTPTRMKLHRINEFDL